MPCDDCSRTETCPPCVNEEEPRCNTCGHTEGEGCGCPAHAFVSREHCWRCEGTWLIRNAAEPRPQGEPPVTVDEYGHRSDCGGCAGPNCGPPLTPEEEERLAANFAAARAEHDEREGPPCSEVEGCDGGCCKAEPPPPQPQRRPPYAVAYAVQGHLYEVALPGDATVEAVDGALVIKHALGMVAGIVGVQPMSFKEAS